MSDEPNPADAMDVLERLATDSQPILLALGAWERACLDAGLSPQASALMVMRVVESNRWFSYPPRRQFTNRQIATMVRRALRDGVETVADEEGMSVNTLERLVRDHERREANS